MRNKFFKIGIAILLVKSKHIKERKTKTQSENKKNDFKK